MSFMLIAPGFWTNRLPARGSCVRKPVISSTSLGAMVSGLLSSPKSISQLKKAPASIPDLGLVLPSGAYTSSTQPTSYC